MTVLPHRSILVIDDDDGMRTMLLDVLASVGYAVVGVADGRRALYRLAHGHEATMLILLDLHLPTIGGRLLLQAIRAVPVWASIPIILMSGDVAVREVARTLDATAVLHKPFSNVQLLTAVKRALDVPQDRGGLRAAE